MVRFIDFGSFVNCFADARMLVSYYKKYFDCLKSPTVEGTFHLIIGGDVFIYRCLVLYNVLHN